MALEIKVDRLYEVSELRMDGYTAVNITEIQALPLIQRYGARKVVHYRKGGEHLYLVKDSGYLRLHSQFKTKQKSQ